MCNKRIGKFEVGRRFLKNGLNSFYLKDVLEAIRGTVISYEEDTNQDRMLVIESLDLDVVPDGEEMPEYIVRFKGHKDAEGGFDLYKKGAPEDPIRYRPRDSGEISKIDYPLLENRGKKADKDQVLAVLDAIRKEIAEAKKIKYFNASISADTDISCDAKGTAWIRETNGTREFRVSYLVEDEEESQ